MDEQNNGYKFSSYYDDAGNWHKNKSLILKIGSAGEFTLDSDVKLAANYISPDTLLMAENRLDHEMLIKSMYMIMSVLALDEEDSDSKLQRLIETFPITPKQEIYIKEKKVYFQVDRGKEIKQYE